MYVCIFIYVCMYVCMCTNRVGPRSFLSIYTCLNRALMYVCVLIELVPAPVFLPPLLLLFLFLGTGGAPGEEAVCLREVMGYNMYT
jgi:hypothetical protein